MGEFFKGWQPKFGVVTLVMACGFMGAWVRSWSTRDQLFISLPHALHAFASAGGTMRWGKQTPGFEHDDLFEFHSVPVKHSEDHDTYWQGDKMEWRWGFAGFDFGSGTSTASRGPTTRMERWAIPYWSLVFPLTLTSALLLFSKKRPMILKQITEPAREKVAQFMRGFFKKWQK